MKESDRQNAAMAAIALTPIFEHAYKTCVKTECDDEASVGVATGVEAGVAANSLPTILDGELFRVLAQDGDRISAQCCLCPMSKKPIRGTRLSTGNFLSHLLRVHPDMKNRVQEKRKEKRGMKRQYSEPDMHPDFLMRSQPFQMNKCYKAAGQPTHGAPIRCVTSASFPTSLSSQNVTIQNQQVINQSFDADQKYNDLSQNQGAINVVPIHNLTVSSIPRTSTDSMNHEESTHTVEDRLLAALERKTIAEDAIATAMEKRARAEDAVTLALEKRATAEVAVATALEKRAKAEVEMASLTERKAIVEEALVLSMERKNYVR